MRRPLGMLVAAAALAAAACGGDDGAQEARPQPTATPSGTPSAVVTTVSGGVTTLRLDREARRFFELSGLELRVIGDAERRDGTLRFPITGGEISLQPGKGRIEHAGGLRFSAGGRHVDATRLIARPTDGVLTAEVRGRRVPLLRLITELPRTLPAPGQRVTISSRASVVGETVLAALGQALDVEALTQGLPLGVLEISAET